ncbi:MAG: HD-GYP domain-containing protein [Acidimicrobiia bacterium]|nr:HD-GYP domain-containing protein [Acidimicrobiia bacterium]
MSNPFDFDHPAPSIEGIRARLAATPEFEDRGVKRPSAISVLLNLLEQRDRRSAEHAFRVAELASELSMRLRMAPVAVARLRLACLLHDVGKLSVPEAVLDKPGPLTDDEWQRVRNHPEYAFQMIASSVHPEVAETVLKHCERIDGKGYPHGETAEEIPIASRILLVADAYDAMLSPRPYRLPLTVDEALENIEEGSGSQFDPEVVAALVNIAAQHGWAAA